MMDIYYLKVSVNNERSDDEVDVQDSIDFGLRENSQEPNSDASLNGLLRNANPETPHGPEIDHRNISHAQEFSTGNTTHNSFEFEFPHRVPKATKNGIHASTPTHNATAPSFFFAAEPFQLDQDIFIPEPPPPPTPIDFANNRYRDVFQNRTTMSVPSLEDAPLSGSFHRNQRIDFISYISLLLMY